MPLQSVASVGQCASYWPFWVMFNEDIGMNNSTVLPANDQKRLDTRCAAVCDREPSIAGIIRAGLGGGWFFLDIPFLDEVGNFPQRFYFENAREATLNNCDEPLDDDLVVTPPTLRDLAAECTPDQAAQLIALASKFDDLIAQLKALKSEERALVARISFVGATPRDVKEARRFLKALRKLAA